MVAFGFEDRIYSIAERDAQGSSTNHEVSSLEGVGHFVLAPPQPPITKRVFRLRDAGGKVTRRGANQRALVAEAPSRRVISSMTSEMPSQAPATAYSWKKVANVVKKHLHLEAHKLCTTSTLLLAERANPDARNAILDPIVTRYDMMLSWAGGVLHEPFSEIVLEASREVLPDLKELHANPSTWATAEEVAQLAAELFVSSYPLLWQIAFAGLDRLLLRDDYC
jgi:hypothetical protein